MGHVFARVSGCGLIVVPISPYRLERLQGDADALVATRWDGNTRRIAVVRSHLGKLSVELHGATSLEQVADVEPGPAGPRWRVETSLYTVEWPDGFAVHSPPDEGGPSMFDLHGPAGSLVYIQGPFVADNVPAPDQMVGPGQALVDQRREDGRELIELAYAHGGEDWRQVHCIVPFAETHCLIVTAQAPACSALQTSSALDVMARSLQGRP
jgi:hypothetical protein